MNCHPRLVQYAWATAWLLLSSVIGCGGGIRTYATSGTVTLDGQPLTGAMVTFQPTGSEQTLIGSGRTDEDGKYTLACGRDQQGTPIGEYKVIITKIVPPADLDEEALDVDLSAFEVVPKAYNAESKIIRVIEAKENEFNFDLTSDGAAL